MLDIAYIRENTKIIQAACKNKNVDVNIAAFLKLDDARKRLQGKIDALRHQQNKISADGAKPARADIKKASKLKKQIAELESRLQKTEAEFKQIWRKIPNIPSTDTPVGKDETANKVIRKVGKPKKFDFKPKPHWELGANLGLIDIERAAKVSGARFSYLKNGAARMQLALIAWVIDMLSDPAQLKAVIKKAKLDIAATPFIPVIAPALIREEVFARTGRIDPKEDKYFLKDDKLFLSGSAEHALAPYHAGEILAEEDLPLRYLGLSTAFRREAGSYGKDVRGILRQHQFDKLEMESLSTQLQGAAEQELMVAIQERIVSELGLPYQVVAISSGDMGKPDFRQIDIETWMAAEGKYRETHTADYVTDYQARSLNIKYQTAQGKKEFVHMNDATAIAVGRILIAIMEYYQTGPGKIEVPKVLQSYMNGAKFL